MLKETILQEGLVFRKKRVRRLFRALDIFLRYFCQPKKPPLPLNPRRILVSHLGGIGDVVMAGRIIISLRERYPKAEIGFIFSSLSQALVSHLPFVSFFHRLDPFYPSWKIVDSWRSYRKTLKEIRVLSYDLALDLQPFFPNTLPFLHRAKIPIRIGYGTAGFSSLLTHQFESELDGGRYLKDLHFQNLKKIGLELIEKSWPLAADQTIHSSIPSRYFVIHMCSSRKEKDWVRTSWIQVIQLLQQNGETVVLTGRGDKDREECKAVAEATSCLNFCNQLNLLEFAALLRNAAQLITVDSAAVHLAALYKTQTIVLYSGVNDPRLWIPSENCRILYKQMACFPCLAQRGCPPMSCIKEITPESVFQAAVSNVGLPHKKRESLYR